MAKARLWDQPEDFARLGINPNCVEEWEDGERTTKEPGNIEVWYFDGNFDDGSKVIIGFRSKTGAGQGENAYSPNLNLDITRPDGKTTQEFAFASVEDSHIGKERCDVRFAKDYCIGNFADYDVHIEGTKTLACDLHYHALVKPFRQGTAVMALGDNEEYFYTDLCVPKCEVTGTLTYDGKTVEVHGYGYHDHQRVNISAFAAFHHWLWGRMYTDKYIVYIYDFTCSERFDFTRIPFFIVADNKTGEILFETNGNVSSTRELVQTPVGKLHPKTSTYIFDNGDRKAEFHVTWNEILEIRDYYGNAPVDQQEAEARARAAGITDMQKVVGGTKEMYDRAGIRPSYMRFFADGGITLTIDGETSSSTGTMIYEFNYPGKEDPRVKI